MESNFKAGFIAILGRPNVGKSTLLNNLIGDKVSIISPVPQTTRHQVKGILNLENAQIVFIDTPGMHSFKDKLSTHLNTIAKRSLEGCDLIIYVVNYFCSIIFFKSFRIINIKISGIKIFLNIFINICKILFPKLKSNI